MKKRSALIGVLLFLINSSLAQTPKVTPPIGHTSYVWDAEFSPDGKKIITTSGDNTAKIWDVETGLILADLKGHTDNVYSGQFSPNGKTILTVSKDNYAMLWNAVTALPIATFRINANHADFSSDGKTILSSSSSNRNEKIWDADSGKLIVDVLPDIGGKGVVPPGFDTYTRAFSRDGRKTVTGAEDKTARIWDTRSGALLKILPHKHHVLEAFFSPDGKKLVTFPMDENAKIWDLSTGSHIDIQSQGFDRVVFSSDGKKFIGVSDYYSFLSQSVFAKIWDTQTGLKTADLKGHTDKIRYFEFSPNGKKIVTASADNTVKIWDAQTGLLLKNLKGHNDAVNSARFSPDGKKIVTAANDNTAKIWDTESGLCLRTLSGSTLNVRNVSFSTDGKSILTGSTDYLMKVWDANTATITRDIAKRSKINDRYISADGKLIATQFYKFDADTNNIEIWDGITGKHLTHLKKAPVNGNVSFLPGNKKIVFSTLYSTTIWNIKTGALLATFDGISALISPDGKKIVTRLKDSTAKIWDSNTLSLLQHLSKRKSKIISLSFSSDSKKIVTASGDSTATIWDAETGVPIKVLYGTHSWRSTLFEYTEQIETASLTPNGKQVIFTTKDNWAGIWDVSTGKYLGYLTETKGSIQNNKLINKISFSPNGKLMAIFMGFDTMKIFNLNTYDLIANISDVDDGAFSPDSKRIVTDSWDHTIKVWNAEKGKLVYTTIALNPSGSFTLLPTGYYDCTSGAAKLLHYVTDNLTPFTFEQLDIKYNRPDKVLAEIGCNDTSLINLYHKAYLKRIEYLKIDTTTFSNDYSIPTADILNGNNLNQINNQLKLHIVAADKIHFLDRFNIWINQTPVFGVNGVSLAKRKIMQLDTIVTITPSAGSNIIETAVINTNGVESYHRPYTYINNIKEISRVYFLGIGIDHFSSGQHPLQWSVNDIRSLALRFKAKFGNNCTVDTLFDSKVTIDRVRGLKQLIQHCSVNDKVILAYSGHGLFSNNYDYYLSGYNIDFDQPQKGGIPYELLEHLMDSIPARQKLILLDACHSGAIDKAAAMRDRNQANSSLDIEALNAAAQQSSDELEKNGGIANQRFFDVMQHTFTDVGRNTGATIISSAAGNQFARGGGKNAIFAACVLEYLNNPHCTISGLMKYVNTHVQVLTKGLQMPTARAETIGIDWNLW